MSSDKGLFETNNYCAILQQLKDQVSEKYPEARRAYIKTGDDFPFLSRPDEVNLHLQLHLRRVGVESRPDLVRGTSNDGSGGSPNENSDGREDANDPPMDEGGGSASPATESQLPPSSDGVASHNLDDQPLSDSKNSPINPE
ncbi:hypothetical protein HHK36_000344 [Tetracentron sinense]|uniref:Maspardin n=1 Tax=Tetracentron sinense TaxID=13715 RepID=A0A834ZVB9_TETSI|nr:hypothetical protein HHK36_000344 [Tetracentron sinense]